VLSTRYAAGFDFARGSWPALHYDFSRLSTGKETSGQTKMDTDSLSVSHTFGKLSLSAAADQTARHFTPTGTTDTTATTTSTAENSRTRQYRVNGRLSFLDNASLTGSWSSNETVDYLNQDQNSNGNAINAQLSLSPIHDLNLSGSYRVTRSTGAVYTGGYTGGYYGNYGQTGNYSSGSFDSGFDSGTGSGGLDSGSGRSLASRSLTFGSGLPLTWLRQDETDTSDYSQSLTDDRQTNVSADWSPIDQLSVHYTYGQRRYQTEGDVGFLADNESVSHSFGLSAKPFDRLSLSGDYSLMSTNYLDQAYGEVYTDSLMFSADLTISKKIGATFGYYLTNAISPAYSGSSTSSTSSGGGVTIITGSSYYTLTGGITMRLSDAGRIYARAERTLNRGGYDDSDRTLYILGAEQQIMDTSRFSLDLGLGMRYIDYASRPTLFGLSESRDYKATTFQAELTARFH
jgi:hypothetical protein